MEENSIPHPDTVGLWSLRFRFRVAKPFASDEKEIALMIGDRKATLESRGEKPLREAEWVVLTMHGFQEATEARQFGDKLRTSVLVAALECSVGIDAGKNVKTLKFGEEVKKRLQSGGSVLLDDLHGVEIYQRTGREFTMVFEAEVSVSQPHVNFFDSVNSEMQSPAILSPRVAAALEMVAISKMARESLSEAALCIAAVEMLASDAPWSGPQLRLINEMADLAKHSRSTSVEEAHEVGTSIKNSFRSIRQSLKRLIIERLKLPDGDWKEFDDVYSLRSAVFHGAEPFDREKHVALATRARHICTRIVLAAIRIECSV